MTTYSNPREKDWQWLFSIDWQGYGSGSYILACEPSSLRGRPRGIPRGIPHGKPCSEVGGLGQDPASGGSDDWAKSKAGIKYVYLLELRPEEDVWDGFIMSETEILPTAKETWEGVKAVADSVLGRNGLEVSRNSVVPEDSQKWVDGACIDEESRCAFWAFLGGCESWPGLSSRCPKSCGNCREGVECSDRRSNCVSWKRMGLCDWVLPSCKKSCNDRCSSHS